MKKLKQGKERAQLMYATCPKCNSKFSEEVTQLRVENDRDGSLARSKCPDDGTEMFFYFKR